MVHVGESKVSHNFIEAQNFFHTKITKSALRSRINKVMSY